MSSIYYQQKCPLRRGKSPFEITLMLIPCNESYGQIIISLGGRIISIPNFIQHSSRYYKGKTKQGDVIQGRD